jgi:hypothetical protein
VNAGRRFFFCCCSDLHLRAFFPSLHNKEPGRPAPISNRPNPQQDRMQNKESWKAGIDASEIRFLPSWDRTIGTDFF